MQSVTLTTTHESTVSAGESVRISATVLPTNAAHATAVYSITAGSEYAVIDSLSGVLTISNKFIGG